MIKVTIQKIILKCTPKMNLGRQQKIVTKKAAIWNGYTMLDKGNRENVGILRKIVLQRFKCQIVALLPCQVTTPCTQLLHLHKQWYNDLIHTEHSVPCHPFQHTNVVDQQSAKIKATQTFLTNESQPQQGKGTFSIDKGIYLFKFFWFCEVPTIGCVPCTVKEWRKIDPQVILQYKCALRS